MDISNYVLEESMVNDQILFMRNRDTNHKVMMKKSGIERGMREVSAYRQFEESPLLAFEVSQDGVEMLLERYRGENLEQILNDKKRVGEVSQHMDEVISSAIKFLQKIHRSEIYHGNIRPENIWIDENYCVTISGFEQACLMDNLDFVSDYSEYTAPEIALDGNVDARLADLFALGRSLLKICDASKTVDFDVVEKLSLMTSVIPEKRKEVAALYIGVY